MKKKRVLLRDQFIEKRKFLLDSKGEKRGITLRRKISQLRKQSPNIKAVKKPKRKVSQKTLNALAKGRAMRMASIKRGKK